jgi:hypothetical protein
MASLSSFTWQQNVSWLLLLLDELLKIKKAPGAKRKIDEAAIAVLSKVI